MADKKPFVAKHGIDVGSTTVFGKNNKLHANNAITTGSISTTHLANTMSASHNLGSTTQIPVIHINDRGQITGASEVNARTVSGFNYTPANNTLTISTNEGTAFKANLSQSEWDAYMTVANTQALFNSLTANTLSQLANTNSYIASVSATERAALANTNAYIASVDTTRNANLANTNAYVASVLASAQTLAGTRLGANALITLDGDATGSAKFNANSASITVTVTNDSHTHDGRYYTETEVDAFVNDRMQVANTQALHSNVTANLNSYIANTNPRITNILSSISGTNTAIRSITTTNAAKIAQVESNLLASNTAIRGYVDQEVAALANSAPVTLNTLNELAAALGDDANFATTVTTNLGQKLGASATVALGGFITGSNTFSSNATSVDTTLNFNAFTADTLESTDSIVFWNGTTWGKETVSDIAGGTSGLKGQKGQKGEVGQKGEKGQKGEVGSTGATGAKGQKGETGDQGATGQKGEKGQKGTTGDTGATGDKGEKGQKGQTGAGGATGAKGQKGERVNSGSFDDGTNTTTFTNSDASTFDVVGLKGQKGTTGDTGATGAKGQKGQKGEVGSAGSTGDTGAKGQKGQKGEGGAAGSDGATGSKGEKGQKGQTGAQGATGATGSTGAAGAKGQKGEVGASGSNGSNGAKGQKGEKGQKGQTGAAGSNGSNGAKGQKGEPGATGGTGSTGQKGQKGESGTVTVSDNDTNATFYPIFTNATSGTASTYINDDHLFFNASSGYFYANRFYTEDSQGYFIDGNSVSYLHELRIDDLLRDKGDTDTYIYFLGDRIRFHAGGVEFMDMVEGGTDYIDIFNQTRITRSGTIETNQEIIAGSSTSFSDVRLKTDLTPIENATEKLIQLNGYHFNWIESNKPSIGLIAQEVEKLFPELISETGGTKESEGGTKTLNYSGLIGVLVESIKELDARVKELESK